jgi:hypothetical protein
MPLIRFARQVRSIGVEKDHKGIASADGAAGMRHYSPIAIHMRVAGRGAWARSPITGHDHLCFVPLLTRFLQ